MQIRKEVVKQLLFTDDIIQHFTVFVHMGNEQLDIKFLKVHANSIEIIRNAFNKRCTR